MSSSSVEFVYSGVDNLEVMLEARRYNRFLTDQVLAHRTGAGAILDFGAGIGTFSEMVRDRGVPVDCVEVDVTQVKLLRSKGFLAYSASVEIPDCSYDYIFSLNVFEHIEDDIEAMSECSRILKPGGAIFVYVPAFQCLFGDMDRKVGHYRRYTRKSLERICRSADLKVISSKYADIAGFMATLVYNRISNGSGAISTKDIVFYDRFIFPVSRGMDFFTHRWIGKNVLSIARKPS